MSMTIKIKRRFSGAPGAPTTLKSGELAFNGIDSNLYFGYGDDGSGNATSISTIGGSGSFLTLTGTQTVAGNKTFTGTTSAVTPASGDSSTLVATTAFVKAQSYLTGNQPITVSGDASGTGSNAISLTLANVGTAGTYPKVTVNAKGLVTSGTTLTASDIPSISASQISNFAASVQAFRLDQFAAPSASVSFNGQGITNVATPINPTDGANKQYVDSNIQGLDIKPTATVATTTALPSYTYANGNSGTNATLTGSANAALVIDSYTLKTNDIVLVKNETASGAAYNGLYNVTNAGSSSSSFILTRNVDMDGSNEFSGGFIPVGNAGQTNANTLWLCNPTGNVVVGSTAIPFTQLNSATQITAGNGISYSGQTISVVSANSARINVSGSGVDLASVGTAGTYRSVTTDAYGRITAGTNPTTLSGYGITDAQSLSANLSSIASLAGSANQLIYFNGSNSVTTSAVTSFGLSLANVANAGAAQSVLGLASMAVQDAGNVAITGGSIVGVALDNISLDGGLF